MNIGKNTKTSKESKLPGSDFIVLPECPNCGEMMETDSESERGYCDECDEEMHTMQSGGRRHAPCPEQKVGRSRRSVEFNAAMQTTSRRHPLKRTHHVRKAA